MRKIRLYVERTLLQDVNLILNPQQSHYICNVMRLKVHDSIFLFNGSNGEWLGKISNISRKSVEIKLERCIREQQHEEGLYLHCAIVKSAALSNIIRQATEMGVTHIQFILTEHTTVRDFNLERAKLQAAEQCGRMSVPEILFPIDFKKLPNFQDRNFILCDETGNGKTPNKALKDKKEIAIIVGPEGGFSPNELSLADQFCQKLSLGKRILKVDTAVVTALAYINEYYLEGTSTKAY